jgi:hypothetical protein
MHKKEKQMVAYLESRDPLRSFKLNIINDVSVRKHCPHLADNGTDIYCSNVCPNGIVTAQGRNLCDHISLQLWCTDNYQSCIKYKEGR